MNIDRSGRIRDAAAAIAARAGADIAESRVRTRNAVERGVIAADVLNLGRGKITELAETVGLPRQRLHERLSRLRKRPDAAPNRLLAALAMRGPLDADQLSEVTGYDTETVSGVLSELIVRQFVRPTILSYREGRPRTLLQITGDGEQALLEWLVGDANDLRRFAVYFPFEPAEREPLARAALERFGMEWWALIEPGTVHGQLLPELAFAVFAADAREAIGAATHQLADLRRGAGLDGSHYAPTDVSVLDGFNARFGSGT